MHHQRPDRRLPVQQRNPEAGPHQGCPAAALQPGPYRETDTAFSTGLATDTRVTRFVGDGQLWAPQIIHDRLRVAQQQEPVGQVGAVRWFIARKAGEAGGLIVPIRWGQGVEVGYWLPPEHRGRGVAGFMVDLTVAMVPEICGLVRPITRIDPTNAASINVPTRPCFGLGAGQDGSDRHVLVPAQCLAGAAEQPAILLRALNPCASAGKVGVPTRGGGVAS